MADKLNTQFKGNPLAFLSKQENFILLDGNLQMNLQQSDTIVRRFTLKRYDKEAFLTLGIYGRGKLRKVSEHTFSHALKGYWLPNRNAEAVELQLGNAADFMFTPNFNGCTFACQRGIKPKVMHIGGDITDDDVPRHVRKLNNALTFGPSEQSALKKSVMDKINDDRLSGDYVLPVSTVIGIRNMNQWNFYVQTRVRAAITPQDIRDFVSAVQLS